MSPDLRCDSVIGKIRLPHACVPSLRRRRCLGKCLENGATVEGPAMPLYYLTLLRCAIGAWFSCLSKTDIETDLPFRHSHAPIARPAIMMALPSATYDTLNIDTSSVG